MGVVPSSFAMLATIFSCFFSETMSFFCAFKFAIVAIYCGILASISASIPLLDSAPIFLK